jgi:protein-disulfide isomerase
MSDPLVSQNFNRQPVTIPVPNIRYERILNALAQNAAAQKGQILQNAIAQNAAVKTAFDPTSAVVLGNPEAKKTLMLALDLNCPPCKSELTQMSTYLKQNPDVKFIIKNTPILGTPSEAAAVGLQTASTVLNPNQMLALLEAIAKWPTKINGSLTGIGVLSLAAKTVEGTQNQQALLKTLGQVYVRKNPDFQNVVAQNLKMFKDVGFQGTPSNLYKNEQGMIVKDVDLADIPKK